MKKAYDARNKILYIVGVYCGVVLCRFLLALFTSAYPMVNIDEFLYYGMARSLSEGKGLMFRGQPANYSYILYSLTLVPVYLFGFSGALLYRMLQLWNILLNSLSVFPLYGLAKKACNDEKRAFSATVICMLLPDFMLGQSMMSENIILPLFFTLFFLFLRYFENKRIPDIICIGLIGGLLFSAKPGAVIPAAVFDIVLLVQGIRTKNRKMLFHAFFSLLLTAAVAAGFFGLVSLLRGKASLLSIYQVQVADGKHLNVFFKFIGIYVLYIILAGGIGYIVVAFRNWRSFSPEQKWLFCTVFVAVLITIIGVSWSVNRYEYNADTAHMRYIGMYVPLVYMFALIKPAAVKSSRNQSAKRREWAPWIVLLLTAALLAIGAYAGVNRYSVFAENATFAIIISAFRKRISAWAVTAIILLLIAFWFWVLRQKEKTIVSAVTISLLACLLINNIAAYSIEANDTRFAYAQQTNKLLQHVDPDVEILYLCTADTNTANYGALDVYSRKGIPFVKLNDMFNYLYQAKGVYQPFVPKGQRGNIAAEMTPDTDTLIMDATVYDMLKLNEENTQHFTENREALHLVKILDRTQPWLDAVIGNTTNNILSAGVKGILLIFNERYLQSPCTMTFQIKCDQDTKLSIYSNLETRSIQLEAGMHEYEVTFDRPGDAYNFEAETGDIRLYGYELTN